MVEDAGNVENPVALLGQAKDQIVILASVKPRPKRTGLNEQRAPADEQVRYVIFRENQIRRPIGFEKRIVSSAVFVDLILIGVEDIQFRLPVQCFDYIKQRVL